MPRTPDGTPRLGPFFPAAGCALPETPLRPDGVLPEAGRPSSHKPDDVARAADLMIRLYGEDAARKAERVVPTGREFFAGLVLREVRARLRS